METLCPRHHLLGKHNPVLYQQIRKGQTIKTLSKGNYLIFVFRTVTVMLWSPVKIIQWFIRQAKKPSPHISHHDPRFGDTWQVKIPHISHHDPYHLNHQHGGNLLTLYHLPIPCIAIILKSFTSQNGGWNCGTSLVGSNFWEIFQTCKDTVIGRGFNIWCQRDPNKSEYNLYRTSQLKGQWHCSEIHIFL